MSPPSCRQAAWRRRKSRAPDDTIDRMGPTRKEPTTIMAAAERHQTTGVNVGGVRVGGGAPVVVQSMCNTDTADVDSTLRQCLELWQAGSELLRVTVNLPEAAEAVPFLKRRLLLAGCTAPLIGDFHYNGHITPDEVPEVRRGPRQIPDQPRERRNRQAA